MRGRGPLAAAFRGHLSRDLEAQEVQESCRQHRDLIRDSNCRRTLQLVALRQCPCAFLMTLRASLTLCLLLCEAGQHWTPGRVLQQGNGSQPPEGLTRFPTTEPILPHPVLPGPPVCTHWRFPPEEDSPRAELGSRKEGFRGPFQPAGPGRWSVPQLGSAAGWRPPPTALAVGAGDREAGGGFGPPHPSAPQLRSRHTCRSPP